MRSPASSGLSPKLVSAASLQNKRAFCPCHKSIRFREPYNRIAAPLRADLATDCLDAAAFRPRNLSDRCASCFFRLRLIDPILEFDHVFSRRQRNSYSQATGPAKEGVKPLVMQINPRLFLPHLLHRQSLSCLWH
jgi:hypothetical protein